MRDCVAALLALQERNKTLTALAEPATAPHDGGALFPDDFGARKPGNARARAKGIACRVRVADRFYGLRGWPEQDDELV